MLVYDGPSKLDGKAVQVILTGLDRPSKNTKTGTQIQSWILCRHTDPVSATRSGKDYSMCGECIHAPYMIARAKAEGKTPAAPCYVAVGRAPNATWKAHKGKPVMDVSKLSDKVKKAIQKRGIRFGSYGDPGAVPVKLWRTLADLVPNHKRTGFSHQWRTAPKVLKSLCVASVDTPDEARQAQAHGWRTFRVRKATDPMLPNEITCPASDEAGKRTTCQKCGLCNGSTGPDDRRKNVVIINH
jgi:hypothetical protein